MLYLDIIKNRYNMKNKINFDKFKWNDKPTYPNEKLLDHEEEEQLTKEEFWRYNETSEHGNPISGYIGPDGTWRFQWDCGDISGFVEGEDFTFDNDEE
jgi:hypothetical protein